MKRLALSLSLSLVLLPAPMLAQARLAGPSAHDLPMRVPLAMEAPPIQAPLMRRASGSRIGLISGGILGAAFGTLLGMGSCSFNDDDQDQCTIRMPLFGLGAAAVGAGLGALIGGLLDG